MPVGRHNPLKPLYLSVKLGVLFLEFLELALPQMSNLHLAYSRVHVSPCPQLIRLPHYPTEHDKVPAKLGHWGKP